MLTQKVNKKKDQAMIAIIIVVLLIIAVILLKNYVFKGGEKGIGGLILGDTKVDTEILKEAPKSFQADILKSEKFQNLIDNNIKTKKIEELKIGNKKPFLAEEEKK